MHGGYDNTVLIGTALDYGGKMMAMCREHDGFMTAHGTLGACRPPNGVWRHTARREYTVRAASCHSNTSRMISPVLSISLNIR